ncbi:MAG TPA: permease prefix domain 1-containing protein, partial [Gemmatimonadaceae bacterium]
MTRRFDSPRLPPGVRRLFRLPWTRAGIRRDLDDELRFHMQMRIDVLRAQGLSEADAETEALRRFGDEQELTDYCLRVDERGALLDRMADWIQGWGHDLRLAVRQIARNPAFTAVVTLTLALAIGCTTAAFSIVYPVLLRGSPYRAPRDLRAAFEHRTDGASRLLSYPTVRDWQTQLAGNSSVI